MDIGEKLKEGDYMKAKMKYLFGFFLIAAVLGSSLVSGACPCKKKKATEQL
jgi:hypothetical protein